MAFILLLFSLTVFGVISYYIWSWLYWRIRGIPGPMGYPFYGSFDETLSNDYPPYLKMRDWTEKYGRVYGYTEGVEKTLVISDPDMVNELLVKQYDNFYGRKLPAFFGNPEKEKRINLFQAQGHRWKRLRSISSPTFSNNSLRKVKDTVEDCALELLRHIEDKMADSIDMLEFYQEYTFDVIARIAMGQYESQMFNNPNVEIFKAILNDKRRFPFVLCGISPYAAQSLRAIMMKFPSLMKSPFIRVLQLITAAVTKRVKQREEDEKKGIEQGEPADFIDLFLDARADVDILKDTNSQFSQSESKVDRKLTVDEIVGQCILFLVAGFDTTALSLSYTTFLLATNPRTMKKLQEEIDKECPDPSISFDQLSKLKYMDCVVKETLRMYPLGTIANSRRCINSTKLGNYEIEKGVGVQVDTWTLHYDKKIWGEDADEFRPERWESGGCDEQMSKGAYLPFGLGPRQCIGMRLAYMEEKLLLSHILRKYTFNVTKYTWVDFKLTGRGTTSPGKVTVRVNAR